MIKEYPRYYSIMPATVRYDTRLVLGARMLYGEITALSCVHGYCWATNSYFAELYKMEKQTIKRWTGQLKDFGYIKTVIIYKQNSKEVKARHMYIIDDPINKTILDPGMINNTTPGIKNDPYNNTSYFNNTRNKEKDIKSSESEIAKVSIFDEISQDHTPVISDAMQHYFQYYESRLKKKHPFLKYDTMLYIADNLSKNIKYGLVSIDLWIPVVKKYFDTFKDRTDCNIIHFASGGIIELLNYQCM